MMQNYIGSDVTSMVTLPVLIFEPMIMLQKMADLMEYSYLLDQENKCEDPYMRMVYASTLAVSVYYAYQCPWKPFNPILGETYEMVNHGGVTFISERGKSRCWVFIYKDRGLFSLRRYFCWCFSISLRNI
ncbi:hypothetical protein ACS0TY_036912 [Phlomoides rotata]